MNRDSLKLLTCVVAVTVPCTTYARADAVPAAVLTVRLASLRSNNGQVGCMIYSSAKGFPTDSSAALQRLWCPIANGASTCAFDPIPAGTYAVACFHDENKKGFMGPPSFDKARFRFSGGASEIDRRIGYRSRRNWRRGEGAAYFVPRQGAVPAGLYRPEVRRSAGRMRRFGAQPSTCLQDR